MLLARDAGVDAPGVVVAAMNGPLALLVVEEMAGTELFDLDADAVTDQVLDDVWTELRTLHAARVAHGKLDARHVLVDGSRPSKQVRIVGFDFAAEQRALPPDRGRRRAAPRRHHCDRRRRARGRRRRARRREGDGRRGPAGAPTGRALGLDPRRPRRARPARRPPRRAPAGGCDRDRHRSGRAPPPLPDPTPQPASWRSARWWASACS